MARRRPLYQIPFVVLRAIMVITWRRITRRFFATPENEPEDEASPIGKAGMPLEQLSAPYTRLNITNECIPRPGPHPGNLLLNRIPPEIRHQIFTYVVGGRTLHLVRIRGRIACSTKRRIPWWHDYPLPRHFPTDFDTLDLSLLGTCRQAYIEAIEMVYRSNVFNVEDPAVLVYLYDYHWPSQHFMMIERLEMQWLWRETLFFEPMWERFWGLLATTTKLRSLKICCHPRGHLNTNSWWVRPMLEVHGVRNVEIECQVETPWEPENREIVAQLEDSIRRCMQQNSEA